MIAVGHPTPALKKLSLLRHFSRGSNDKLISVEKNEDTYNAAVRPPIRDYRISRPILDDTPPQIPASVITFGTRPSSASHSDNGSLDLQMKPPPQRRDSGLSMGLTSPGKFTDFGQVPRLTKDKSKRRRSPDTLAERFEMLEIVRSRHVRKSSDTSTSSDSSISSNSSNSRRSDPRALSTSMPTKSFTSNPKIAPWTLYLPPAQVYALYLGAVPVSMEDRFFVYSEGPDMMGKLKVHFHRSWTGAKVAEVFVVMDVKGEGAGKIVGVKWDERNGDGSGRMTEEEAKLTIRTAAWCVLGIEMERED